MSTPEDCPYDSAQVERRTAQAGDHAIRIALLEQAMKNITAELHAINGNIGKLIWLGTAAIGASAMQFILRGGLFTIS
jgi:hypothetical protein